jgi:hypothetical protein
VFPSAFVDWRWWILVVMVVVGSRRSSTVTLDLCGWKGVPADGSGGDSSPVHTVRERSRVFVGAGSASSRALLGELRRGSALMNGCQRCWALVIVVGAGGMGMGRCHLLSMVALVVVGGVVNLQDVVVVVEESNNVTRCNIGLVVTYNANITPRDVVEFTCKITCRCSHVKILFTSYICRILFGHVLDECYCQLVIQNHWLASIQSMHIF